MYPSDGYRVITNNTDIIFEKKHPTNYTRICLPGLNQGFVAYVQKFCNFYKCNFSNSTFTNQVNIWKPEADALFKASISNEITHKAYLHRKIELCNIGLVEKWHSPVFVIKINSHVIATTGHNKIYATYLRNQKLNLDFDCYVMDFDKNPENFFINVQEINTDKDFSNSIGSTNFALDISVENIGGHYVPAIIQYAKEYPINYHDSSYALTTANKHFFDKVISSNNKIDIFVADALDSFIFDSSEIFNIVSDASLAKITLTTNKRIRYDLAKLLPFFTEEYDEYSDEANSYTVKTNNANSIKKISSPADLL